MPTRQVIFRVPWEKDTEMTAELERRIRLETHALYETVHVVGIAATEDEVVIVVEFRA